MINKKDVIRIKIPYPSVNSGLAQAAHMYICKESANYKYEYVKCQTLKPYMFKNGTMRHYCDEQADLNRNPFEHTTRIDCDKVFATELVKYDELLKTTRRSTVCDELFQKVLAELAVDGYNKEKVNEIELTLLNDLVTFINE